MRIPALLIVGAISLLFVSASAAPSLMLHVDLSERMMDVRIHGETVESYSVGIGTSHYPTPTGAYSIRRVIWNPRWVPPRARWARGKRATPPGHPDNPMRVAKIFFRWPDYYIHGTGELLTVGEEGSHGCLRMPPAEVRELGELVMAHGGRTRPDSWYQRVLRHRRETSVRLRSSIGIEIVP